MISCDHIRVGVISGPIIGINLVLHQQDEHLTLDDDTYHFAPLDGPGLETERELGWE